MWSDKLLFLVSLLDSDGQADGLWELSYRWWGGDGWSDGQLDRQGKMVYRWSGIDVQSDGLITGWTGRVTDGHVNDELNG